MNLCMSNRTISHSLSIDTGPLDTLTLVPDFAHISALAFAEPVVHQAVAQPDVVL